MSPFMVDYRFLAPIIIVSAKRNMHIREWEIDAGQLFQIYKSNLN